MNIKKLTLKSTSFPEVLRHIDSPPQALYQLGAPLGQLLERPVVTIVGSRSASAYGQRVTEELAGQLAERGVVVVSGLALGIDGIAHRAALQAGGLAIAVLPGPVDNVVPRTNRRLAQAILDQGGALVSEYTSGTVPQRQYFIARNRLMAGLGQVVVVTEAAEKSGSLYTADFAIDQGKTVLAIPGNITNIGSVGTNNLLKSGATPLTSYLDFLHALGLQDRQGPKGQPEGRTAHEQTVIKLLAEGVSDGDELLERSGLSVSHFNQALAMLEIGGKIRPLGANHWALY